MRLYLAGPITGCSYKGCTDWREALAEELLAYGIYAVSPMRGKEYLKRHKHIKSVYQKKEFPLSTNQGIYGRDTFDVATCDITLANFLGATQVSIGTVMEVQRAYDRDKYVLVVMEESNVHEHPFVLEAASIVVRTLEEAVHVLAALVEPYMKDRHLRPVYQGDSDAVHP